MGKTTVTLLQLLHDSTLSERGAIPAKQKIWNDIPENEMLTEKINILCKLQIYDCKLFEKSQMLNGL